MNLDRTEALSLTTEIRDMAKDELHSEVGLILCPPAIHLSPIKGLLDAGSSVKLGAQNCHSETKGAFTGEISASMLASYGVDYVILGHSERRQYFGEDAETLSQKVRQALENGLSVIFCCGESLTVRESGEHLRFVVQQLSDALFGFDADRLSDLVLAYEPVWAIGTGKTATAAQAQEMHRHLRAHLAGHFGEGFAQNTPILYGGSCKPGNAAELFSQPDVDGGLIGGASLKSRDFIDIARSFPKVG